MDGENLDDGICEQFRRQLGHSLPRNGLRQVDLKPLALANAGDLTEAEATAGAGNGLTLRIVDLWLQHHVDDESGHIPNSTPGTLLNSGRDPSRGAVALKGKP